MNQHQKSSRNLQSRNKFRGRKDADTEEIIRKLSETHEDNFQYLRYEFLKGRVSSLISTQSGSILMQSVISKANSGLIKCIYIEISRNLNELLRQTYANYFCQTIFNKLDFECKHEFIVFIFSNLSLILKNMISFRAAISILENPMQDYTRKVAIDFFIKIDHKELLTHIRYIKAIETLLPRMSEDEVAKIIEMVNPIFKDLLGLKQGYFLIKKLIKKSVSEPLKLKIISLIKKIGIAQFLSNNNGYLLTKCILKNFLSESQIQDEDDDEEALSLNQEKIRQISSQIESLLYKEENEDLNQEDSSVKENSVENPKYQSVVNPSCFCDDKAVIEFFDILTHELIFTYSSQSWSNTLNKLHKKIVTFFLDLNGGFFRIRLIDMLLEIESVQILNNVVCSIMMLYKDLALIEDILSNVPQNPKIAEFFERLTHIKPSQIPKEQEILWTKLMNFQSGTSSEVTKMLNSITCNDQESNTSSSLKKASLGSNKHSTHSNSSDSKKIVNIKTVSPPLGKVESYLNKPREICEKISAECQSNEAHCKDVEFNAKRKQDFFNVAQSSSSTNPNLCLNSEHFYKRNGQLPPQIYSYSPGYYIGYGNNVFHPQPNIIPQYYNGSFVSHQPVIRHNMVHPNVYWSFN